MWMSMLSDFHWYERGLELTLYKPRVAIKHGGEAEVADLDLSQAAKQPMGWRRHW